jgi:hypothetical protein
MDDVRLLDRGVMDADTVAHIGYCALMAGRRVVIPGLYNQLQIQLTRFLPRSTVVKMSKAMLQRTQIAEIRYFDSCFDVGGPRVTPRACGWGRTLLIRQTFAHTDAGRAARRKQAGQHRQ